MKTVTARSPLHFPIAVDERTLANGTGVGTYARSARQAVAQLTDQPFSLVDRRSSDEPLPSLWQTRARALLPIGKRASVLSGGSLFAGDVYRLAQIWFDVHHTFLPIRVPGPPGIAHWTYPLPLEITGWHNLYTIHDLIPLLRPELTSIDANRHRRLLSQVAKKAAGIITVSEASRQEILKQFGCPPHFVYNCWQAVCMEPAYAPLPSGLEAHGYLLVLGTVERRKNIGAICKAFRRAKLDIPLVVVGPDGSDVAALQRALIQPGIVRMPYQPEAVIHTLVSKARALIMPSWAEGFGLPVAEAMSLGTPVITSDSGALQEVSDGAAILVDPANIHQLVEAMQRIAEDDDEWTRLSAAGRQRAERYSPERFTERLLRVYERHAPT